VSSIYRDYSGARSSVDRDGNKFDKSICSTTTTRSSLSAANVCRACLYAYYGATSPDSCGWSKYLRLIILSRLINVRRYRGVITTASRGTRHFARRSLEYRDRLPGRGTQDSETALTIDPGTLRAIGYSSRLVDGDHRCGLISKRFRKLSSSSLRCYSHRIRTSIYSSTD